MIFWFCFSFFLYSVRFRITSFCDADSITPVREAIKLVVWHTGPWQVLVRLEWPRVPREWPCAPSALSRTAQSYDAVFPSEHVSCFRILAIWLKFVWSFLSRAPIAPRSPPDLHLRQQFHELFTNQLQLGLCQVLTRCTERIFKAQQITSFFLFFDALCQEVTHTLELCFELLDLLIQFPFAGFFFLTTLFSLRSF